MADVTLRSYVFLDDLQPQLAAFIGTTARGFLPLAGDASMLIETAPGLVINRITDVALGANEALKAARVKLVDASLFGAYGRLYLSGPEAQIDAARDAALRALGAVKGKEAPRGEGR